MNKRIVHDALILMAFTLILGLALGFVYDITKKPIAKANKEAAEASYKEVFKEADSFKKYDFDSKEANKFLEKEGYSDTIDGIQTAFDKNGEKIGYVITVTAKDGSQGYITLSVGIKNDGTVNGYSITSIAETPGLGMKATEEEFSSQFNNKKVDQFNVVKNTPSSDNEIEAITASTITSKAVANGCNASILYFQNYLQGGDS